MLITHLGREECAYTSLPSWHTLETQVRRAGFRISKNTFPKFLPIKLLKDEVSHVLAVSLQFVLYRK